MRISDGSSDVCSSDRGVIDGDRRWTYAEFADRCDRQARLLTDELGVQRGDVVAWLCGNTHELLEAYYGVRSEERRLGKQCVGTCSFRWSQSHYNKKHAYRP